MFTDIVSDVHYNYKLTIKPQQISWICTQLSSESSYMEGSYELYTVKTM